MSETAEPEIVRRSQTVLINPFADPQAITLAKQIIEAFEAGRAQAQAWRPTAEEVARIIDPHGWDVFYLHGEGGRAAIYARNESLAKARAILALRPTS